MGCDVMSERGAAVVANGAPLCDRVRVISSRQSRVLVQLSDQIRPHHTTSSRYPALFSAMLSSYGDGIICHCAVSAASAASGVA